MVTRALVLAHSDYRDNDRMVTLLTPDQGRVDAIARGCKKPRSPLMNATERFCAGEFTLLESRGRFTLTDCQITESFYPLREDMDRLSAGAYFLHLLLQAALPGQDAKGLFLTALKALAFLAYDGLPAPLVTLAFELHYLHALGLSPRVDCCVVCGRPLGEALAHFDARLGGAVCPACPPTGAPLSNGARRILLRVPRTRFEVMDKLDGHPDWPEAARHARAFLADRIDPPRLWPDLSDNK